MNSTLVIGVIIILLGIAFGIDSSWNCSSGFFLGVGFVLLTFNKEIQWRFENEKNIN